MSLSNLLLSHHTLQVVVFDLEFGQPAGSTPLPASRPAFSGVLGCYGHAAVGPGCKQGGVDLLYCSHQASMSLQRHEPQSCLPLVPSCSQI